MAPSAAMRCWKRGGLRADGSVDYCATAAKPKTPASAIPLSHIDNIVETGCPARPSVEGDFPCRRCVWRPAAGLPSDHRADAVPFPVGFHLEAGGYRARHYPADADLLRLLWRGVPCCFTPTQYASVLAAKMAESGAEAWLVNTGWNGEGKRLVALRDTRSIISAILNGTTGPLREETIPGVRSCDPAEHSRGRQRGAGSA